MNPSGCPRFGESPGFDLPPIRGKGAAAGSFIHEMFPDEDLKGR